MIFYHTNSNNSYIKERVRCFVLLFLPTIFKGIVFCQQFLWGSFLLTKFDTIALFTYFYCLTHIFWTDEIYIFHFWHDSINTTFISYIVWYYRLLLWSIQLLCFSFSLFKHFSYHKGKIKAYIWGLIYEVCSLYCNDFRKSKFCINI